MEGLVLRPLSAKLLPPTVPEIKGWVNREALYAFRGRTRKPQMALAEEFGLTEYPSPAGGCLLTDPIYSYRLRELLNHNPDPSMKELSLLRVGRHFRLSASCKAVVGRNRHENEQILALAGPEDTLLRVPGVGSPVTILTGFCGDEEVLRAAEITARYSDAKYQREVTVLVYKLSEEGYTITVSPLDNETINSLRVAPPEPKGKRKKERALISL